MLFIIGLGLSDENDITLKGINAIKASQRYSSAYIASTLNHTRQF